MTIRAYKPTDYAECIEAFHSNEPEFFAEQELEEFRTLLEDLADIKKGDFASSTHYFVVETAGRVAACAGFYLPPDGGPAMLVWGMVARRFHRQGIGKLLLTFRLDKIQELHPGTPVILDTTQWSYPFFEKLGFRITKITSDFYAPGLDRYDMVRDAPIVTNPA
nr:GNAT family N-acetyltransferase [uncultured Dyadobacter sp.]